jgi:hypothetical protein
MSMILSSEKGIFSSLFANPKAYLNNTLLSEATKTTPEKLELITLSRQSLNDNCSSADVVCINVKKINPIYLYIFIFDSYAMSDGMANGALSGKTLLAKISEERTKANCFLSVLERLVISFKLIKNAFILLFFWLTLNSSSHSKTYAST